MRIVTHTPRIYVEEWEVKGLPATATDAEVLAILRGEVRGSVAFIQSKSVVDTGPAFVFARGQSDLEQAGRRIAEARANEAAALDEARTLAKEAFDGGASEREVATLLGVDRNTVRAWRGKARSA